MKRPQTTALLAATIALAFAACDNKTADTGTGKPADPAKPAVVDEKTATITLTSITPNGDKKPDAGGTDMITFTGSRPMTSHELAEATAIWSFRNEVEAFGKWAEEKQKAAATNPAASMAVVGEVVAKFKTIKTDGLPADLKGAWGEMGGVMGEMGDAYKAMPKMDGAKPEEMGKVMTELMPKIMALQAKVAPIAAKIEEVGKKYGIEMSKVAPSK